MIFTDENEQPLLNQNMKRDSIIINSPETNK